MQLPQRRERSELRAVIDANVWIAGAIRRDGFARHVYRLAASGAFQPVTCDATLAELKETYTSPRLARRFVLPLAELNELIRLLTVDGVFVPDPEISRICRDPKDDIYIALALASGADCLVTRDDDLKGDTAVREHLASHGCTVVTIQEFVSLLQDDSGDTSTRTATSD